MWRIYPLSTSSSFSFHRVDLSLGNTPPHRTLSSARAVDLFLHILLLLLHYSYLVPREYSHSQVWDELVLSSARAVDLLLILLWTGWSIGKSIRHTLTHRQTDRAKYWRPAQYGASLENINDPSAIPWVMDIFINGRESIGLAMYGQAEDLWLETPPPMYLAIQFGLVQRR